MFKDHAQAACVPTHANIDAIMESLRNEVAQNTNLVAQLIAVVTIPKEHPRLEKELLNATGTIQNELTDINATINMTNTQLYRLIDNLREQIGELKILE